MISNATKAGLAATLCIAAMHAYADQIPGLVNTGFGLSDNQIDYNYMFSRVQGTATGTSGYGVVTTNSEYPIATAEWIQNTQTSSWLAPTSNQGQSYDQRTGLDGIYNWTLHFDLTGKNASTAELSMRWISDNDSKLYLNGVRVTNGTDNWQPFSIGQGFVDGVNSLRFEVVNFVSRNTNPTGLRVEFFGSSVSAVPETATYFMLLFGLGAVGAYTRMSSKHRGSD